MITVDHQRCMRCKKCVDDCVVKVLVADKEGVPHLPAELERFCLNCQHCLAICPTAALSCNGITPDMCAAPGPLPRPDEMMNLIRMRRSCRHYKNENIPPEIMTQLKSSLAWTPTGCNDRKLFFRIIENKEEMEFFRNETSKILKFLIRTGIMFLLYPRIKRFLKEILNGEDVVYRNAPHMIVAAVSSDSPCKEADPWISLTQFDLFAQALGIGTCWCGFAGYALKASKKMQKKLRLPAGYKIGAVMLFGPSAVQYERATTPDNFNL